MQWAAGRTSKFQKLEIGMRMGNDPVRPALPAIFAAFKTVSQTDLHLQCPDQRGHERGRRHETSFFLPSSFSPARVFAAVQLLEKLTAPLATLATGVARSV
jgi:hypothetical protein